jgi:hypothetical protein
VSTCLYIFGDAVQDASDLAFLRFSTQNIHSTQTGHSKNIIMKCHV